MSEGLADFKTDWASVELPDAWPDQLDWKHPLTALRLLRRAMGRSRERVQLPSGMPGSDRIAKYILQEFHNLPNGNYSKQISAGYARWFDRVMLGSMAVGRARLAQALAGAERVIDLGCGGGHMAGALKAAGTPEVVGLDPSPYLLQFAAKTYPGITWVHGMAETTGMPNASFDGASLCFLLHEVPPLYLRQILAELRRIVRPGGRVAVLEPSVVQWRSSMWRVWRSHGWRGMYFKAFGPRVRAVRGGVAQATLCRVAGGEWLSGRGRRKRLPVPLCAGRAGDRC
jgi:ubiquinone/menaquinone biosynthesis C-methylase UbiE